MGIQLDWEVEAEQSNRRSTGEDPEARRRRRRSLILMLITLVLLGGLAVAGTTLVFDQIDRVNERLETNLRDTVQAEITALRIGDWTAFARVQRSATDDWLRIQRSQFERYQDILLASENTQLTGQVLDIAIDDPNARVTIQEIIDGVPYSRVWFYYLYPEQDTDGDGEIDEPGGWYHVPPDFTFWGESAQYDGAYVDVAYRTVDFALAEAMGPALNDWVGFACQAYNCENLPEIRVQVVPQDTPQIDWAPGDLNDVWTLILSSPYADRARSDMPFSPELRAEVAQHFAERLTLFQTGGQRMVDTADANYLFHAAVSWLVGQYRQVDTGAYLIASLARQYGLPAVGQMIATLAPGANISFLSDITGAPLDESQVDWRDFFTWRLHQEQTLWEQGLRSDFLALYDVRDSGTQVVTGSRFDEGVSTMEQVVTSVGYTTPAEDGSPQIVATVVDGAEEFQVLFRLVNNRWYRAS
jgi:hypothetical protein